MRRIFQELNVHIESGVLSSGYERRLRNVEKQNIKLLRRLKMVRYFKVLRGSKIWSFESALGIGQQLEVGRKVGKMWGKTWKWNEKDRIYRILELWVGMNESDEIRLER